MRWNLHQIALGNYVRVWMSAGGAVADGFVRFRLVRYGIQPAIFGSLQTAGGRRQNAAAARGMHASWW